MACSYFVIGLFSSLASSLQHILMSAAMLPRSSWPPMAFAALTLHTSLVFFFQSLQQVIYICAEGEVEKGCSRRHFGL